MGTGLTYLLTVATLAIALPYLRAGSGHDRVGDTAVYRYPTRFCRFFLCIIPVYAAGVMFIFTTYPAGEPSGTGLIGFSLFASFALVMPAIGYLYFNSYRAHVDVRTLKITTVFHTKVVDLQRVAQIVTIQGRWGPDLFLYDKDDARLAHIDSSIQDFNWLLSDVERHTRSPHVMRFQMDQINGWQERTNEEHGYWRPSKGPKTIQESDKRIKYILVIGLTLVGLSLWVTHAGLI